MSSFLSSFSKAFKSGGEPTSENQNPQLTVKWGKEKINIILSKPLSSTPLAALRAQIASKTSLAPSSFKIVFSGGICQAETRLLSEYGIREGSMLAIIGGVGGDEVGKVEREIRSRQESTGGNAGKKGEDASETQPALVERIKGKVGETKATLGTQLEEFEAECSQTTPSSASTSSLPPPVLQKKQAYLSESLLQLLLFLDSLECPSGWDDARKERKEAVRTVQGLLDRLDAAWVDAKARAAGRATTGEGEGGSVVR